MKNIDLNFKYRLTFVDTATDEVTDVVQSNSLKGMKLQMRRHRTLQGFGHVDYKWSDWEACYVMSPDFYTEEGIERIKGIAERHNYYIDEEVFLERGVDFDMWYDYMIDNSDRTDFNSAKGWT